MKKINRLLIGGLIVELIVIAWGISVGLYDDSIVLQACKNLFN